MVLKSLFRLSLGLLLMAGCKSEKQADLPADIPAADTARGEAAPLDSNTFQLSSGEVQWEASKPAYKHNGTLLIQSGYLNLKDSILTGGEFILDMNSVQVNDLSGEDKTDLETHLKEGDFFETQKFPQARFVIRSATPKPLEAEWTYEVAGELTLKGISKPVAFPVRLEFKGETIQATTPQFSINRTDWGINYKSGVINTVKDQLINDELKIKILLETAAH